MFEIPPDTENGMNVPGRVFGSREMVEGLRESKCLQQVVNVAKLPGIVKASIAMQDIHSGYGFPIGGVAAFDYDEGILSPGGIGYDINCGVALLGTGISSTDLQPRKKELVENIFRKVPSGMSKNERHKLSVRDMDEILLTGLQWSIENGYATADDMERTEENGCMKGAESSNISPEALKRGTRSIGTIGGGNHFIEIQAVEGIFREEICKNLQAGEEGECMILIHTGSRGLGHQVATDYIRKINESGIENRTGDPQLCQCIP